MKQGVKHLGDVSERTRHGMMERRKSERHSVGGTASFHWRDAYGTSQEQTANIRNVSAAGLFIETISPPPVGTEILIQIYFDRADNDRTAAITTRGQINRVEDGSLNDKEAGFAASTGRMSLHRLSEAAVERG